MPSTFTITVSPVAQRLLAPPPDEPTQPHLGFDWPEPSWEFRVGAVNRWEARRALTMLAETLTGRRATRSLLGPFDPPTVDLIARLAGPQWAGAQVASLRVQRPAADCLEVSGRIAVGDRSYALALRIRPSADGWTCTHLEAGVPGRPPLSSAPEPVSFARAVRDRA